MESKKDGHRGGKQRIFESNAGIIIDQGILFPFLSQENDAGKGAQIHKGIGHEVEEDS